VSETKDDITLTITFRPDRVRNAFCSPERRRGLHDILTEGHDFTDAEVWLLGWLNGIMKSEISHTADVVTEEVEKFIIAAMQAKKN
jgi:hypothetical protein